MAIACKLLGLTASVFLVFATAWTILPAPTRALLVVSVGATELCAWVAAAGLALCALTLGLADRGMLASVTIVLSAAAAVLASLPLARVPPAVRRFNATMSATVPHDAVQYRPTPLVLLDPFRGIAPDRARVTRGLPFASPGGVALTLDVYQPEAAGRYPVVVQIYGGSWQRGAPGDDAPFATYLAARGFVVFAIDYRHAPASRWPAQIDDVRAALAWIRAHAGDYGADDSRLALLGRSAGAQLAMVAGYDAPVSTVSAVVSWYGPVDLVEGHRHPPSPDPLDVRAIEEAYLGGTPDQVPDRYRDASPISYASRRLPPSLLIYGSRDHTVLPRFGRALDARLRAAGNVSVLLEIPWAEHAFDAVPNGPSGQIALYYTERFLAWALKK